MLRVKFDTADVILGPLSTISKCKLGQLVLEGRPTVLGPPTKHVTASIIIVQQVFPMLGPLFRWFQTFRLT